MNSFSRFILSFAVAILLASCAVSGTDSPPINRAPTSTATRGVFVPPLADTTPQASALATTTPTTVSPSPSHTSSPTPIDTIPLRNRSTPDHQTAQQDVDRKTAGTRASASPPTPTPVAKPKHPLEGAELYVHLPPQANPQQPLRVLLVLHGMGGSGEPFSQNLLREAERNHWVIVAPTFQYHDYLDPKQLREDDIHFAKRILDTLDVLPQRLNVKLRQHILIYGFSRGAQLAHRFAYFYPDRVGSVVALSAGAYTLPAEKRSSAQGTQVIPFPYGVGDLQECVGKPIDWQALRQVSFWIGVGARDDQANDVSRAFDPYGGKTRVERARTFQQALQAIGIDARLVIFPDAAHEVTSQMRASALQFLRDDESADHWDD